MIISKYTCNKCGSHDFFFEKENEIIKCISVFTVQIVVTGSNGLIKTIKI